MKDWEKRIAATKKLDNTYVVVTDKGSFVCTRGSGNCFVINHSGNEEVSNHDIISYKKM